MIGVTAYELPTRRAVPAKIHLLQIYIGYIQIHILNFRYVHSNLQIYILNIKNISSKP